MKKTLLLAASVVLATSGVSAANVVTEPEVLPMEVVTKISPNGQYTVSANPYFSSVTIFDLGSGLDSFWTFAPAEDDYETFYDPGTGNAISNNGILVLTTNYNGTASYAEDGKIYSLTIPADCTSAMSHGISANGNRICGNFGITMSIDGGLMQYPCYWDRQADNTYGSYQVLPYPTEDWTGRLPQYVQAICISEDGKTISGMVRNWDGATDQPIVWVEDEEGKWSYRLLGTELLNPEGLAFPEWSDSPDSPNYEDFMTEEELAAYNQAYQDWWNGVTDDYPAYKDFMTEEEYNAYLAAKAEYEEAYTAWSNQSDAFYEVLDQIQSNPNAASFMINQIAMSNNGNYVLATNEHDPGWWGDPTDYRACPVLFDIVNGTSVMNKSDEVQLVGHYVNDRGNILASRKGNMYSMYLRTAYYYPTINDQPVPLQDYVKAVAPEVYPFMEENMVHDLPSVDEDYNPVLDENVWCTGIPCADEALSFIALWAYNEWDSSEEAIPFYSYYLPLGEQSGIENVVSGKKVSLKVSIDRAGVVTIAGEATALNIYDLNGRLVYSESNPAATVATGLKSGNYVVKATDAKGNTSIVKAVI